ncbi:MAG: universal stress protein [Actinomycetaceae bacterium]|nr:universal stress protein [Actinomycetaceae bacterium]
MASTHVNKVVCGIDGSKESLNALTWAANEAKMLNGHLEIVCSYEHPTFAGHTSDSESIDITRAKSILAQAEEHISSFAIPVTTTTDIEHPAAMLIEKSQTAKRVVIGSQSGRGIADRFLGSVATDVCSRASCATIVVPPDDVNAVLPIRQIICGIDSSASSQKAIEIAAEEANRWKARLTYVHAVNFGIGKISGEHYRQNTLDKAKNELEELVAKVTAPYSIETRVHAVEGNAATVLTRFSTTADLLIVGTRGRGGFAGLLLGSTSQSILQRSTCPTLVVRTQNNEDTSLS